MLVLARKSGETIHIGDSITVSVVAVRGRQVKLAIEAPRHVSVHRHEIYERLGGETGSQTIDPDDDAVPTAERAHR